jgi:hypothetical protein
MCIHIHTQVGHAYINPRKICVYVGICMISRLTLKHAYKSTQTHTHIQHVQAITHMNRHKTHTHIQHVQAIVNMRKEQAALKEGTKGANAPATTEDNSDGDIKNKVSDPTKNPKNGQNGQTSENAVNSLQDHEDSKTPSGFEEDQPARKKVVARRLSRVHTALMITSSKFGYGREGGEECEHGEGSGSDCDQWNDDQAYEGGHGDECEQEFDFENELWDDVIDSDCDGDSRKCDGDSRECDGDSRECEAPDANRNHTHANPHRYDHMSVNNNNHVGSGCDTLTCDDAVAAIVARCNGQTTERTHADSQAESELEARLTSYIAARIESRYRGQLQGISMHVNASAIAHHDHGSHKQSVHVNASAIAHHDHGSHRQSVHVCAQGFGHDDDLVQSDLAEQDRRQASTADTQERDHMHSHGSRMHSNGWDSCDSRPSDLGLSEGRSLDTAPNSTVKSRRQRLARMRPLPEPPRRSGQNIDGDADVSVEDHGQWTHVHRNFGDDDDGAIDGTMRDSQNDTSGVYHSSKDNTGTDSVRGTSSSPSRAQVMRVYSQQQYQPEVSSGIHDSMHIPSSSHAYDTLHTAQTTRSLQTSPPHAQIWTSVPVKKIMLMKPLRPVSPQTQKTQIQKALFSADGDLHIISSNSRHLTSEPGRYSPIRSLTSDNRILTSDAGRYNCRSVSPRESARMNGGGTVLSHDVLLMGAVDKRVCVSGDMHAAERNTYNAQYEQHVARSEGEVIPFVLNGTPTEKGLGENETMLLTHMLARQKETLMQAVQVGSLCVCVCVCVCSGSVMLARQRP